MLASVSISFAFASVVFLPVTRSIAEKKSLAAMEYLYLGLARVAFCSFFRSITANHSPAGIDMLPSRINPADFALKQNAQFDEEPVSHLFDL